MARGQSEIIGQLRAALERDLHLAAPSLTPPPAEVQEADRAALAIQAIREAGIRVWFEPDLRRARQIQRECRDCRVFAPTGHLRLIGDDECGPTRHNEPVDG